MALLAGLPRRGCSVASAGAVARADHEGGPGDDSASAGTAAVGGVSPSATAAIRAASGTVKSVASETIVGLIERSTKLKSECPMSWPKTVKAAIRTQSAVA